jgi:amidohydrolase
MKDKRMRNDSQLESYVVGWRRRLHANPELSFQEHETAKAVATELRALGLAVKTGVGGTGVVGLLAGDRPGRTVALRADMDALPITEGNAVSYKSRHAGRMHACGHDGHCAMLLGAARLLSSQKSELQGNVKFLFQPGEETPPGGALAMIRAGALQSPKVDAIFGLHLDSSLPSGRVGLRTGPMMAASDNFKIEIIGRGGHAARPHSCLDPVVTGAQIILALQTIVSRKVDPVHPAVITVGKVESGSKHNIIPDRAVLEGTARSIDRQTCKMMPEWIKQAAAGVAQAGGLAVKLYYQRGYPVLVNDPAMIEFAHGVSAALLGKKAVMNLSEPMMGGEDFAYYLQKVPGAFLRLGSCSGPDTAHPWHHPQFNIDESVLPGGARLLAALAGVYLAK